MATSKHFSPSLTNIRSLTARAGRRAGSSRTRIALSFAAGAVAIVLPGSLAPAATIGTWAKATNGTWNTVGAAGWTNGVAPNGIGDVASLDNSNSASSETTTNNTGNQTVGTLSHYGTTGTPAAPVIDRSWIIAGGTGTNGLTLNQDGAGPLRATISNALIATPTGVNGAVNNMIRVTGDITLNDDVFITNTSNSARATIANGSGGSVQMQARLLGIGNLFISNSGGTDGQAGPTTTTGNDPNFGPIGFSAQGAFGGNTTIMKGCVTYTRGDCFGPQTSNLITLGSAGGGNASLLQAGNGAGFNMENSFAIAAGSGGTLLLGNFGTPTSSIILGSSVPSIVSTFVMNDSFTLTSTLTGGKIYDIRNPMSGVGGVTKIGSGDALFSSTANSYQGATIVNAGNLYLGGSLPNTSAVTVNTGFLQLQHSGTHDRVIHTGALTIAATGKLDLTDNKLITTSSVAAVQAMIVAGQGTITAGQPAWNGTTGIITSETAASSSVVTTLAVASAANVKGISGAQTAMWGGQTVAATDTLVMYTYNGDANLDGKVNADDYFQIDSNYNKSGVSQGFYNGDFNYDGQINGDDYTLIDTAYAGQGAPISAAESSALSGVSAVPEPASIGLLSLAATGLMNRHRRRRNLAPS